MDGSYDITEPNVIFFGGLGRDEWPRTDEQAAEFWVVVVDYHC